MLFLVCAKPNQKLINDESLQANLYETIRPSPCSPRIWIVWTCLLDSARSPWDLAGLLDLWGIYKVTGCFVSDGEELGRMQNLPWIL